MKRGARILVVAMALSAGLVTAIPQQPASAGHESGPYFDLSKVPATDVTGKQIFDGLKQFVADFPLRITGSPNEILAGQFLHNDMVSLGYEVNTLSVANGTVAASNNMGVGAGLKAIVATKRGKTLPNDWVMFVGHYDTVPQTIEGAYDNGAGSNFIRYIAREFSNVDTNRSVVFVWFNGEEEGLLASAQYAEYLKNSGQKVTAVFGFDMVGIAYPVAAPTSQNCLCMWYGPTDGAKFDPLLRFVNFDFLGFPEASNKVKVKGVNSRNSDEKSFINQGFPSMRWAGMQTAGSYNGYHNQNDTIANISAVAGGDTYYEQGIENTLKSVYFTAMALDNHFPEPALTVTTDGLTASLDASASTDQDGALTGFSWDFGDGTTGTGEVVDHTYGAPGTYTVTLTVADNRFPAVTRTATTLVTVS